LDQRWIPRAGQFESGQSESIKMQTRPPLARSTRASRRTDRLPSGRPLRARHRHAAVALATVLSLVFAAAAAAAPQVDPSSPVPLTGEVRWGQLPNGLRYFIRANPRPQGRADLRLVVNAGSILEDEDQLGAAHFIEHMSFNGTRRFPKNELVSYLQSVGVRLGGDLNATTGFDETIYVLPIPVGNPELVDTGLAILREWAGNVLLTDADIEAERAVVLAELRSGQASDARVRQQTMPQVLNGSRYAARLPIGTDESLRTMTPDALRRFYRDWYRPDLQAVIVVGDIDVGAIERRVRALFADLPAAASPRPRPGRIEIPPRRRLEALVVADPELSAGRIDITEYIRPQPPMTTVGAYDALIQDQLVNRMLGMRLFELTDQAAKPFLAARAQRTPVVRGYEAFVASAAVAGQDPVEAVRVLAAEIERARRFGFSAEELDAAKKDIVSTYAEANAERHTSESDALADELGRHFLTGEPVPGIAWEYERVRQVIPPLTLEAFNAYARGVLEEPGSQPLVLYTAPSAAGASEAALRNAVLEARQAELTPYRGIKVDTRLLEREPPPGRLVSETTDAALGTTTLTYANGVRVVLKPTDFKSDEVLLTGARYGGQYLYEQADHYSAAHLVESIDAMGYGTFTPAALRRFLGTRRADASVGFGPYVEEVSGGSTRGDITTLLQLVYLKLTSPRLDLERFEASRAALKGLAAGAWNSPEQQWDDFNQAVLSQDHPRAPRLPKPADFDQIDPARSIAIYRERFGNASGMNFTLVGSFTVAETKPLVARYLGGLPASKREARFRDLGVRYQSGRIERVLRQGSVNSALAIVYTGQRPYSLPEKLKLDALTEVLTLRVIDRIREQLGSAYSPGVDSRYSKVPAGEYALRFSIGCTTRDMPVIERTVDGILRDLQERGPTPAEIEKVTRTWLNEHEARSKTNAYWAGRLRNRLLDPDLDAADADYVARVNALSAADVQAAARTFASGENRVRLALEPGGSAAR
jgi:zinc protease